MSLRDAQAPLSLALEWERPANTRGEDTEPVRLPMGKESDKTARDLLLDLIDSDMSVARAFAAVARAAYDQGEVEAGNDARLRAIKFCAEARQSILQIAELDQCSALRDLENLRASIESLPIHIGELEQGSSGGQKADNPLEALPNPIKRLIPSKLNRILRRSRKS